MHIMPMGRYKAVAEILEAVPRPESAPRRAPA
jgi:hypothetical protein